MKTLLTIGLLVSALSLGLAQEVQGASQKCFIVTHNGHYLTAVAGGGQIDDAIHSDATQGRSWETFTLVDSGAGNSTYGIKTLTGNYLTAVDGGGLTVDVIHSDAAVIRDWEEFKFYPMGDGYFGIQTHAGNFLTAVGGGGRTTDVIHSNQTGVGPSEKFKLKCNP